MDPNNTNNNAQFNIPTPGGVAGAVSAASQTVNKLNNLQGSYQQPADVLNSVQYVAPVPPTQASAPNTGFSTPAPNYAAAAANNAAGYVSPEDRQDLNKLKNFQSKQDEAYAQQQATAQRQQTVQNIRGNILATSRYLWLGLLGLCFLVGFVSLLGFIFELGFMPKPIQKLRLSNLLNRDVETTLTGVAVATGFDSCVGSNGVVSFENGKQVCKLDGKVVFNTGLNNETLREVEREEAKNNQVTLAPQRAENMEKLVAQNFDSRFGSQYLVMYTEYNSDLGQDAFATINNLFLSSSSSEISNDISVKTVENFLNNELDFNDELLGDQSAVLRAFDMTAEPVQSKTIGEINSDQFASAHNFEKIRVVYGVDQYDNENVDIKVRVFGKMRDNYVMLHSSLPADVQSNLQERYLDECTDGDNLSICYMSKVDQSAADSATDVASKLLNQFKFNN